MRWRFSAAVRPKRARAARWRPRCGCQAWPLGLTLGSFDFGFQPSLERSRIDTLATSAWVRQSQTLLIQGPPGVGNTHLAVGLGVKAVEQGFSAQFYRFDELLTALKADAHVPPTRLRRKKYLSTALLIIDEMGFEPMDREEASLFFRLVTYRYGRGSILITTNKSVRDWTELLAGDEVLTAAPSWTGCFTRLTSSTSKGAATGCRISIMRWGSGESVQKHQRLPGGA